MSGEFLLIYYCFLSIWIWIRWSVQLVSIVPWHRTCVSCVTKWTSAFSLHCYNFLMELGHFFWQNLALVMVYFCLYTTIQDLVVTMKCPSLINLMLCFILQVYYVYGFMLLVFVILIIVTICVTIVGTYFLLNAENYHWQWTSFFSAASTALYVYLYSIYYYHVKTKMSGFFQTSFYFGYTLMFCLGLGILCGKLGSPWNFLKWPITIK